MCIRDRYKEIESFSQFSSELDTSTREQIEYGQQLMELLKQPLYQPKSLERQVITLCVATSRKLLGIPKEKVAGFVSDFYGYMEENKPEILEFIRNEKQFTPEQKEAVLAELDEMCIRDSSCSLQDPLFGKYSAVLFL